MFDPIRELIAENKIAQALANCGDLDLKPADRSRLISLRRRWDQLMDKDIAQTSEQRLLTLEGNGIVDDLLKWLDQMEYSLEAKEEWSVKVTHTKKDTGSGAAAGAGNGSVKSNAKWLWLGAVVVAAFAVGLTLMMVNRPEPTAGDMEARELPQNSESHDDPPAREERTPPREVDPPETTPTVPGKTKYTPGDLVAVDPGKTGKLQIDPKQVQINPDIRLNSEILKKLTAANALMTSGEQVDIAVVVYNNDKAPTTYNASASKALATYLDQKIAGMDVAYNVLTQKFHDHEQRDRLFRRGLMDKNSLSAQRARFLLLVDLRKYNTSDKAFMNLCLYDVERNKSFPKNKLSASPYTSGQQIKEMYSFTYDYLKDMNDRGILK